MKNFLIGNKFDNPYEVEWFEILTTAMFHRYGTVKEDKLYPLLYLRSQLLPLEREKGILSSFLLDELNLSGECQYQGIPIAQGPVLRHFLDNLAFKSAVVYELKNLEKIKKRIHKTARFRTRKFRNLEEYDTFFQYFLVEEIAKEFKVEFNPPMRFDQIEYDNAERSYKRCLEEQLDAIIHAVRLHSSHVAFVSEEKVEDYLVRHLDLLEDGMRLMSRQVIVPDGRIDVLARDKNDALVIIEIKVEEDKDILWQCVHYPEKIKEKERVREVRMITVCPDYKKHILNHLKEMPGVEIFSYTLNSELGRITEMNVKKEHREEVA